MQLAPTTTAEQVWPLIVQFVHDLPIDAVCLYGSVARGDADASSDIDLMVVAARAESKTPLRRALRAMPDATWSITVHTWDSLRCMVAADWSFARHLAAEGWFEGASAEQMRRIVDVETPEDEAIRTEILAHLQIVNRLQRHADVDAAVIPLLARIYTTAKRVAILLNARHGVYVFQRRAALETAETSTTREPLEMLLPLERYYIAAHRHREALRLNEAPRPADAVAALRDFTIAAAA